MVFASSDACTPCASTALDSSGLSGDGIPSTIGNTVSETGALPTSSSSSDPLQSTFFGSPAFAGGMAGVAVFFIATLVVVYAMRSRRPRYATTHLQMAVGTSWVAPVTPAMLAIDSEAALDPASASTAAFEAAECGM